MHIHYSPPCSRLICAWVHCIHTYTPLSSHLHVTPPRRTESATCGRVVRQLRLKTPHLRATRRGTLAQRMLNEMGQVVWSQSRKHGRKRRRSGVAGTGHTAPAHTVCSIRPSSPPTVNRAAPLPSGELPRSICMCVTAVDTAGSRCSWSWQHALQHSVERHQARRSQVLVVKMAVDS